MQKWRHFLIILTVIFTGTSGIVFAEKAQTIPPSKETEPKMLGPESWPETLDAVVDMIIAKLSEQDRQTLKQTKKADLIQYHFSLGMWIRNYYGLWRGNEKLLLSACGKQCHPDDASMIIIEAVWEKLQKQAVTN